MMASRKEIERTADELGAMSRKDLDMTARKYGMRIGMFTRKADAVRYMREELGRLSARLPPTPAPAEGE